MDFRAIIDDIASRAEDFLAGADNRAQGRAGIAELLNADYHELNAADRKKVTEAVMAILEHEDFFDTEYASGAFDEDNESEGEA